MDFSNIYAYKVNDIIIVIRLFMNKTDIALIIPTLSRPQFVINQLKFYNKFQVDFEIYICESSNSIRDSFEKELASISDYLKIYFFHKPGLNEREAIYFLLEKCKTKYVAFIGDDDFLIPEGLISAKEFLLKHKDYRVAYGSSIQINMDTISRNISKISTTQYWKNNSFVQNSSIDRLEAFSKNYFVPLFALHRTNEFFDDFKPCLKIPSKVIGELLANYNTIGNGKAMYLPVPYLIRQNHPQRYLVPQNFIEALVEDKIADSVPLLRQYLKELFIKLGQSDINSLKLSNDYLKIFLMNCFSKDYQFNQLSTKSIIYKRFVELFFMRVYLKLKNLKFKRTKNYNDFKKYLFLISSL